MSKPPSGLYSGTKGDVAFYGDAEAVIASRVAGLNLNEHPISQAQLGSKAKKAIAQKVKARTATKEEYKRLQWDKRLNRRRKAGIDSYWDAERSLLLSGKKGTRNWSSEQVADIIAGRKPKYNGKTMQAHHSYSVSKFPHLANRKEVIYPATELEHFKGWHGGSFKKSTPGKRIRRINQF